MSTRESPITPTVGRIVLVRGEDIDRADPYRELPAVVVQVWAKNCVSVEVLGLSEKMVLTLVSFDSDPAADVGRAWKWMEYQVQQDAKATTPETQHQVSTHLSRAETELHDLSTRFTALGNFLGSAGFGALPRVHRELLVDQHDAMQVYRSILMQRVQLLTAEA